MARLIKRSSRRRDTEAPGRTLLKSGLTLLLLSAVLYVGLSSYNGVPGRDYSKLYVQADGVGNLIGHDPVRIAGVRVGQVKGLKVADGRTKVELQLEPGVTVPVDSDVRIRANGLLGARYVQIIPGRSAELKPDGSTLRAEGDALTFGVPDTLDTFDSPTRRQLRNMVDSLGAGVFGHGRDLNSGVDRLSAAAPQFTDINGELLARPEALGRLVPALNRLMGPLDAAKGDYAAMLRPGARALEPFADQRAAWRKALDEAPSSLAAATTGLGRGERLLVSTAALARAANRTLPTVPRGLRSTTELLRSTPDELRKVDGLLEAAAPAVPAALRVTRALDPVLPTVRSILEHGLPIIRYIGPRGCDIENFGVTMRSMTGFGGTGRGPIGPSMEFRAQVIPTPEALSPGTLLSPARKDAYATPCKYLSKTYPYVNPEGGRR
jgi:virulence factor Mce-like protein